MKTVILATNNVHKVSEISHALDFPGWEFKTLREAGIESDPVEDADDFLGNARIKALAAHEASGGLAALADDSGLVVDALDGAPGVYSSRFAGEDATDEDNNAKLLADLADVPDDERTARFVCTLVFIDEDGSETCAHGTVEGRIGHGLQGEGGFGYDPLFWPDVFDGQCTLAEVPQSRKNEVSHRGNALRSLRFKIEVAEAKKAF
ncbi:MAG: RdgB/HAM1 family non-canonical purine NTP pyrophosphatase [Eggerthellaceae bacterium]|nr:RdgB/HAM1 family non-canonical purine NTP pyrophosphatase [Eggerthellaceae bacterium]